MNVTDLRPQYANKISVADTGCWIWTSGTSPQGYGLGYVGGRQRAAHRIVYEALVGPIESGLVLDHLCRVTLCVNPAHLEPVTAKENTLRGRSFSAENARKTHCPKGHPYDDENTRHYRGGRYCRACLVLSNREASERRSAERARKAPPS